MPTTKVVSKKIINPKLEQLLRGCKFSYLGDRMNREYVVTEPGLVQGVYRRKMHGLKEELVFEGTISQMLTGGDKLCVTANLAGKPVEVFIDMDEIVIL